MASITSNVAQTRLARARSATTDTPRLDSIQSELRVVIRSQGPSEYRGTRAQLEAEGVIPPGTAWPEGTRIVYWNDERCCWWLSRARPDADSSEAGDWWSVRCDLKDGAAMLISQKRRELDAEIYRQSAAGRREFDTHLARYVQATGDAAFQAFKAGILPPRPARGRKADAQGVRP